MANHQEVVADRYAAISQMQSTSYQEAADKLFEDLMGTAIVPRKAYIKKHSKEASDNV